MKKHLLFAVLLIAGLVVQAQIGVGTDTPDASAILEIKSPTKGFLPSRMTEAKRNSIASPAEGLVIYNTDEGCINYWNTTKWVSICEDTRETSFTCGDAVNGNVSFTYNGGSVTYGTVLSATGKCWLDRNLGAVRVAIATNDYLGYGDLFQWGRGADGHQLISWTSPTTGSPVNGITYTISPTDTPGHSNFIATPDTPHDWRSGQNNNLWNGVDGTNNPCPTGFRIPTQTELTTEVNQYNITNTTTAYASPFKFTAPGYRYVYGQFSTVGEVGYYWSSSANGILAGFRYFTSGNTFTTSFWRGFGYSIRCVKD